MKKIALFTINGYTNYGNRLQNYAVEQLLFSFGYDVETIIFDKPIRCFLQSVKSTIESKKLDAHTLMLKQNRIKQFKLFSQTYLHEKRVRRFNPSEYCFFVTGSDQVWGDSNHAKLIHKLFTRHKYPSPNHLPYGKPSQRFSISAGTCGDINEFHRLCPKYLNHFRNYVKQIENISVREDTGAEIVKTLTGRDSTRLLDPTMLIDRKVWENIFKRPEWINNGSFILVYLLGILTDEYRKMINEYENTYGCQVIWINNRNYSEPYLTDPSEFLWLIANAKLVITDSFHGVAFSIINRTPFIVIDRVEPKNGLPDMSSRIKNILSIFSLKGDGSDTFEGADKVLEKERERAMDFLSFLRDK